MNEFASTENSEGMLKTSYDTGRSPLEEALRRKRKKLAETKGMEVKEEEEDA
jgi:hypothetical protein